MKHELSYITTDLQLQAPLDLAPLADELVQRGLLLHFVGPWQNGSCSARFASAAPSLEPDPDIAVMLSAIEALDEPSRNLWAACTSRNFDIGYDCGDGPSSLMQHLSPATLVRIAAIGAGLTITIYPVLETDAVEAAIAILKKDNWIRKRRGKANGYGIHHTDSSSLKKNQAAVKVTLYGKKESVYVHCLMQLSMEGEWAVKEIVKKEVRVASCTLKSEASTE